MKMTRRQLKRLLEVELRGPGGKESEERYQWLTHRSKPSAGVDLPYFPRPEVEGYEELSGLVTSGDPESVVSADELADVLGHDPSSDPRWPAETFSKQMKVYKAGPWAETAESREYLSKIEGEDAEMNTGTGSIWPTWTPENAKTRKPLIHSFDVEEMLSKIVSGDPDASHGKIFTSDPDSAYHSYELNDAALDAWREILLPKLIETANTMVASWWQLGDIGIGTPKYVTDQNGDQTPGYDLQPKYEEFRRRGKIVIVKQHAEEATSDSRWRHGSTQYQPINPDGSVAGEELKEGLSRKQIRGIILKEISMVAPPRPRDLDPADPSDAVGLENLKMLARNEDVEFRNLANFEAENLGFTPKDRPEFHKSVYSRLHSKEAQDDASFSAQLKMSDFEKQRRDETTIFDMVDALEDDMGKNVDSLKDLVELLTDDELKALGYGTQRSPNFGYSYGAGGWIGNNNPHLGKPREDFYSVYSTPTAYSMIKSWYDIIDDLVYYDMYDAAFRVLDQLKEKYDPW